MSIITPTSEQKVHYTEYIRSSMTKAEDTKPAEDSKPATEGGENEKPATS